MFFSLCPLTVNLQVFWRHFFHSHRCQQNNRRRLESFSGHAWKLIRCCFQNCWVLFQCAHLWFMRFNMQTSAKGLNIDWTPIHLETVTGLSESPTVDQKTDLYVTTLVKRDEWLRHKWVLMWAFPPSWPKMRQIAANLATRETRETSSSSYELIQPKDSQQTHPQRC